MRYFFISLAVVLLIIFGIVLFNRGGSNNQTPRPTDRSIKLSDFVNNQNGSVQYLYEGPINASENHRTMQIVISPNSRVITVFTGYQNQVITTETLDNNTTSYGAFLSALGRVGFTNNHRLNIANSASVCPTGNRTHYIINDAAKEVMNLWSASCTSGTYGGSVTNTATLFQTQIPNYSKYSSAFSNTATQ